MAAPPATKFTWTIENFSKLNTKRHFSDAFIVGDYEWRVLMFPKGNAVDHLSLYLDVVDSATLPYGWSRFAQFSLSVINQVNSTYTVKKDIQHKFSVRDSDWGFLSFMPLGELNDPSRGFLVNDVIILEAKVAVCNGNDSNKDQSAEMNTGQEDEAMKKLQEETKAKIHNARKEKKGSKHVSSKLTPSAADSGTLKAQQGSVSSDFLAVSEDGIVHMPPLTPETVVPEFTSYSVNFPDSVSVSTPAVAQTIFRLSRTQTDIESFFRKSCQERDSEMACHFEMLRNLLICQSDAALSAEAQAKAFEQQRQEWSSEIERRLNDAQARLEKDFEARLSKALAEKDTEHAAVVDGLKKQLEEMKAWGLKQFEEGANFAMKELNRDTDTDEESPSGTITL